MSYKIKAKKVDEFFEIIDELEKLLSERIIDTYEVKGLQQARHAYVLYRKLLWEAKSIINDNLKGKKL